MHLDDHRRPVALTRRQRVAHRLLDVARASEPRAGSTVQRANLRRVVVLAEALLERGAQQVMVAIPVVHVVVAHHEQPRLLQLLQHRRAVSGTVRLGHQGVR